MSFFAEKHCLTPPSHSKHSTINNLTIALTNYRKRLSISTISPGNALHRPAISIYWNGGLQMNRKLLVVSTFALALGSFGLAPASAHGAPAPAAPMAAAAQDRGWEEPPGEFHEVQKKGFHDGVEGARKDAENHRRPSVENRDEYKHPDVPHRDRREYRDAFRRGYQMGVEHLMHDGPR
jgi:hypothetical protein